MRTLIVSPQAGREFQNLIRHSEAHFGPAAADRYQAMFEAAYMDLRRDPQRPGAVPTGDGP